MDDYNQVSIKPIVLYQTPLLYRIKYERVGRTSESYFIPFSFLAKPFALSTLFPTPDILEYPSHCSPSHLLVSSELSPQSSIESQTHGLGIHLPFVH